MRMKISYIITPFESSEYLIRCVNSLYRQIGSDYEVILSENNFGKRNEELNGFLNEKKQLVRISKSAESPEAKLTEAIRLVSDDSDYVMFVDVDTVVSPVAAQAILKCKRSDMIIPAAAVRNGSGFLPDFPDAESLIKNIDHYVPDRICFSKALSAEFAKEFLQDQRGTGYRVLARLAEGAVMSFTEDVCLYMEKSGEENEDIMKAEHLKTAMARAAECFEKNGDINVRFAIVDKLVCDFLEMIQNDRENAFSGYAEFWNLCKKCKASPLLNLLAEKRVGCKMEDFLHFSPEEYELYRKLSRENNASSFVAADPAVQDGLLDKVSKMEMSLEELKKDVAALRTEQKIYTAPFSNQPFLDPVKDIPRMYREGRLGFRIILRSFKCWLIYKLGRDS